MAVEPGIDRLSRALDRTSLGPVGAIVEETGSRLGAAVAALLRNLRWAAADRPLITLLLAFQAGWTIGRLGGHRAQH